MLRGVTDEVESEAVGDAEEVPLMSISKREPSNQLRYLWSQAFEVCYSPRKTCPSINASDGPKLIVGLNNDY